jgi:hypothetical protein
MWPQLQEELDFHCSSEAEIDREAARISGQSRPYQDWILSDRDVWYINPSFEGEPGPHPESYEAEYGVEPNPEDALIVYWTEEEMVEYNEYCWRQLAYWGWPDIIPF